MHHDPHVKLIPSPKLKIWPLDGLWPPNRDLYHGPHGKRDPTTKVFRIWPLNDIWPNMVNSIMIPRENWSHHQSLRTWPLDYLWPQKLWHTSWSPGKPDTTTKSNYRARFHTHKSKKQHLTIYKFDLPFSFLNLIYKQIICNPPIWKIQPLSDAFLFKKLLLVSYFPHFCPHFGPGKSLVTPRSKTNTDQCCFFFWFFFCPLAPLPPFKLAVFIQRDYLIED